MGYPFFTWKPHQTTSYSGGARVTIDLTEILTDLQITPRRDVVDSFSIFGGRSRENLRAWMDIRIQLDRFTDRELFRKFRNMIDHLERGGSIAFGNDSEKCYASQLTEKHYQGTVQLHTGENLFTTYHSDAPAQLAQGDEIVVESFPPKAGREYQVVHSHTAGTPEKINLGPGFSGGKLVDSYGENARVRHTDFWPVLILPTAGVGAPMLTHDRRMTYTLDILLSYVLPVPEPQTSAQGANKESTVTYDGIGILTDKPDYDIG